MNSIKDWFSTFLDFIDNRTVIRRIVLFYVLYLTWYVTKLGAEITVTVLSLRPEAGNADYAGIALMIGAITAPAAMVVKWALEMYSEARNKG